MLIGCCSVDNEGEVTLDPPVPGRMSVRCVVRSSEYTTHLFTVSANQSFVRAVTRCTLPYCSIKTP